MKVNVQKGNEWKVIDLPCSGFGRPDHVEVTHYEAHTVFNPGRVDMNEPVERRFLPIREIRGDVHPALGLVPDPETGRYFYAIDQNTPITRLIRWELQCEIEEITSSRDEYAERNKRLHMALITTKRTRDDARFAYWAALAVSGVMTFIAIGSLF